MKVTKLGMKIGTIVSGWWIIWLLVSYASFTSLKIPGNQTAILVIVLISAIFIGIVMPSINKRVVYDEDQCYQSRLFYRKVQIFALLLIGPFIIFGFLKAINIFITQGVAGYRVNFFTSGNLVYTNDISRLYHMIIVSPLITFTTITSFYEAVYHQKWKLLFVTFLLGIMNSVLMLGRFYIYEIIVILLFSVFILPNTKEKKRKNKHLAYKICVVFVLLILVLTFVRDGSMIKISELIKREIIDYHTIGFLFIDRELNNPTSFTNEFLLLGQKSFGFILRFFHIVMHQLLPGHEYPSIFNIEGGRNEWVSFSTDYSINSNVYNAFYTAITTLYVDGRTFGIVIGGYVLGSVISSSARVLAQDYHPVYYMKLTLSVITIVFSIFQSRIELFCLLYFFIALCEFTYKAKWK
jgi:oligosaccharide repeat unit polymerase